MQFFEQSLKVVMERCQVLVKSARLVFPGRGGQFAIRRSYHRQRAAESVGCRWLIRDGFWLRQIWQRSPDHHDVPHASTNDFSPSCHPTRRSRRRFAHPGGDRDGRGREMDTPSALRLCTRPLCGVRTWRVVESHLRLCRVCGQSATLFRVVISLDADSCELSRPPTAGRRRTEDPVMCDRQATSASLPDRPDRRVRVRVATATPTTHRDRHQA
jgi:hypothetical protein